MTSSLSRIVPLCWSYARRRFSAMSQSAFSWMAVCAVRTCDGSKHQDPCQQCNGWKVRDWTPERQASGWQWPQFETLKPNVAWMCQWCKDSSHQWPSGTVWDRTTKRNTTGLKWVPFEMVAIDTYNPSRKCTRGTVQSTKSQLRGRGFESAWGHFETWAISFNPRCLCLSEERPKAVGPLYVVNTRVNLLPCI